MRLPILRWLFAFILSAGWASASHASRPSLAGDGLGKERFAVALKYTGLSYHPDGGENEERYKRSLDSRDFWVLQVGGELDGDYKLHRFLYLRAATSLYRDCADVWAGLFHFGFRANWSPREDLSFRIGIGPTYLWRQNWLGRVKGYKEDSFFGKAAGGDYQGAFIWHGGDIEAEWKAWEHAALVYSVVPGYPEVIQNSLGARYSF